MPDCGCNLSIAGLLSHPTELPSIPVKYIGILSRFYGSANKIQKNALLILLSGPEPQRTEFENILLGQLANSTIETVVVRGLPAFHLPIPLIREGIQIWNDLPSVA